MVTGVAYVCRCSHGVERTGLFCAMMNMLDQLVADKEVDVYDAVKRVRQARPEFVDSIVCLYVHIQLIHSSHSKLIICPIAIAYSMGQITKPVASVRLCKLYVFILPK